MSNGVISTIAYVLVVFLLFLVALYFFRKTHLLKRFFVWSGLQRLWERRTERRDTDRASIQLKRTTRVPSDGTSLIRVPLPREPERVYAENGQGRGVRRLSSDSDTLVNVAV
ncbi:hypothetical protein V5O48_010977 [Marasmius crinis-equi]|uniref:Uncharacterized protein n=1 Tax=Marasmius crinis-equi TaxID=585013 RepID=A0ABR3F7B2_9AGAR